LKATTISYTKRTVSEANKTPSAVSGWKACLL
jgi:hypothetical protein